jgi:microcystin-dependent protein
MASSMAGMIQMTAVPAGGPGSSTLVPADNTTVYEPIHGWLVCNGASISRDIYPELFNAIQYTYGGSGNNFNLPDLRGRFPIGGGTGTAADATAHSLNQKNGREKVTLSAENMPYHRHSIPELSMSTYGGFKPSLQVCNVATGSKSTSDNPITYAGESRTTSSKNNAYTGASNTGGSHTHTTNPNNTGYAGGSSGAATAHENMPPYIGVNFIIATGKIS